MAPSSSRDVSDINYVASALAMGAESCLYRAKFVATKESKLTMIVNKAQSSALDNSFSKLFQ